MATTATLHLACLGARRAASANRREALALFVCAALPLGLIGLVDLAAETFSLVPLFFTPFGLPAWSGAAAHLVQLALLGAAYWALTRQRYHGRVQVWLLILIAAYIVLPFVTPALDSLQLGLVCTAVFVFALATIARVGAIAPLVGWMLAPMLVMTGLSAALGLAMAAYAPPFALMQSQQPPSAA